MSEDTTELSYWMNWKFFSCAAIVLASLIAGVVLVLKDEGLRRRWGSERRDDRLQVGAGVCYKGEAWTTCLRVIHPAWLLGFRVIGFLVLFSLITVNLVVDGGGIMYYYTQWTFTLVTMYSALGCAFSIYGLCKSHGTFCSARTINGDQGNYVAVNGEHVGISSSTKSMNTHGYGEPHQCETAGLWGYLFQIVFQVCGGAVVLTDAMFWFVLFPFLMDADYKLDFVLSRRGSSLDLLVTSLIGAKLNLKINGCMHSVNAVFILGDTLLNGMRFPMFRIGYFAIWTSVYVIFQWIVHACINLWWPYPFLDLKFPNAPLWYLGVAILHVPCYGIFALIVRLKNFLLSRSFPESYQGFW